MCTVEDMEYAMYDGLPLGKGGEYPVISIKRPWIDLILRGFKSIETRTRPRPKTTDGLIVLLHASKLWQGDFRHIMTSEGCEELQTNRWEQDDIEGKILCAAQFGDSIESD